MGQNALLLLPERRRVGRPHDILEGAAPGTATHARGRRCRPGRAGGRAAGAADPWSALGYG